MSMITVATARGIERFRRAGIEFGSVGITIDTEKLTQAQIGAIRAEPRLVVTEHNDVKDNSQKKDSKRT